MTTDYRSLTADDIEQAAQVEALAFYERPTPQRVELLRTYFRPEWTVGAFVDGKLVADTRTLPMSRRINGGAIPFGAVGPVACLAQYRRQGHVGRLLRLALERMRENGQPLSGLYTPHNALYARYGWERAEGRRRYEFAPKDVKLRFRGARGRLDTAGPDDWERLDRIYRAYAEPRNGPFHRIEPWWREAILRSREESAEPQDRDAIVWVSPQGQDEGYVVYEAVKMPRQERWIPEDIWVRDFVSLSGDAYLGLWEHLFTHDITRRVWAEMPPDDPFPDLLEDPWKVTVTKAEGAMLRVVDVERAVAMRPYTGELPASFTMRIEDPSAPWNDGVWRIEAAEGRTTAERTDAQADFELTANTLAPLFTSHLRPDVAAGVGILHVNRPEALAEMTRAFSATYPPFCNDMY